MINPPETTDAEFESPRLVAVIDIGASSLRMQIAEIHPRNGHIRKIESLSQAVSIGKDSFANRTISRATIEDCVHVLEIYRQRLNEYGISDSSQIRVVATSGVREECGDDHPERVDVDEHRSDKGQAAEHAGPVFQSVPATPVVMAPPEEHQLHQQSLSAAPQDPAFQLRVA